MPFYSPVSQSESNSRVAGVSVSLEKRSSLKAIEISHLCHGTGPGRRQAPVPFNERSLCPRARWFLQTLRLLRSRCLFPFYSGDSPYGPSLAGVHVHREGRMGQSGHTAGRRDPSQSQAQTVPGGPSQSQAPSQSQGCPASPRWSQPVLGPASPSLPVLP